MSRPSSTAAGSAGRAGIAFAALCVVTLLAYARSFGSPFQFDDNAQIVGNRILAAPSVQGLLGYGQARILPFATLALNYQLGGENPFSYHVVNFVVHLLATFAVFQLALALCRSPRMRDSWVAGEAVVFATAAALFFACHPIQVQAVTYVVQRMSSMAALFYVGCVLLYVRARNAQLGLDSGRYRVAFAFSLLLALAAFFSKENTASLPIAILLVELVFYPTAGGRGRLLRLAPFAALALAIPLTWGVRGRGPGYRPDAAQPLLEQTQDLVRLLFFRASPGLQISPLDYLLTQAVVIPRYLALVVLPWGFNVDHDVPIVAALSGQVLAGLALLVALFAVATHALRDAPWWASVFSGCSWR